jgi:hypothetical protein
VLCAFIILPGLICHYLYPDVTLGNVGLVLWFCTFAVVIFLFPFIRLILHVLFYHCIPEKYFNSKKYGNVLYYASEMINYITFFLWILSNFVVWVSSHDALLLSSTMSLGLDLANNNVR